ncbi:hypothetical protein Pdw03_6118 [Penicillium digitatum]|uniref:BZIP domain-containing protein n=1 Tax=Penicillium digitatum TaxID=36651 RepID=A0A7T7BJL9_PENDI|nr:hypothetical protein Pdw03_6118 [Penicillium digitatum]
MNISDLLSPSSTSSLIQPSRRSASPQQPSEQRDSHKSSLIPCTLYLESGSYASAAERKKNSAASQRYRARLQENRQLKDENISLRRQRDALNHELGLLRHRLGKYELTALLQQTESWKVPTKFDWGQEMVEEACFDVPIETVMYPTGGGILSPQLEKRGK